jgi:hypothetical protein
VFFIKLADDAILEKNLSDMFWFDSFCSDIATDETGDLSGKTCRNLHERGNRASSSTVFFPKTAFIDPKCWSANSAICHAVDRCTVAPLRSILTKFPQASCAMDDLEETIFQRNVPGKYSRWEGGERSDVRAMEDDNGPSDE